MNTNDLLNGERVRHIRELKAENSQLRQKLAESENKLQSVTTFLDLAILATDDMRNISEGGKFLIVDGYNVLFAIFGRKNTKADEKTRQELITKFEHYLEAHPQDKVWIIFDGPFFNVSNKKNLRISFTGGEGGQRADKFIVHFLTTSKYLSLTDNISLVTNDEPLRKAAEQRKVKTVAISSLGL